MFQWLLLLNLSKAMPRRNLTLRRNWVKILAPDANQQELQAFQKANEAFMEVGKSAHKDAFIKSNGNIEAANQALSNAMPVNLFLKLLAITPVGQSFIQKANAQQAKQRETVNQ